jgi:hypothetical protein
MYERLEEKCKQKRFKINMLHDFWQNEVPFAKFVFCFCSTIVALWLLALIYCLLTELFKSTLPSQHENSQHKEPTSPDSSVIRVNFITKRKL